jgi:drug/metabolite transporter (DMT)-like permease
MQRDKACAPQYLYGATASATNRDTLAFLSLLASGVVWGLIWWPLKFFAAAGLDGHAIGLTAYSLVAVAALPFIWRERARWRAEAAQLVLIGLFFGCANMAFTAALTMGSVVRAMLLFYLLPAWGALGGALFLGERIGPRRLLAVLLSLTGVFTIVGGPPALRQPLSVADGMALAAGLCYAAAGIANRKASSIPMASRTLVSFVGCMAVSWLALGVSVPVFPVLPAVTWTMLALFAGVWLLGGTLLTTYGVTYVPASRAAVLQVVELLVAVGSSVWLAGEPLQAKEWIGGALITAATLIEALDNGHPGEHGHT